MTELLSTPQCSICGGTPGDHQGRAHKFSVDGKVHKAQPAEAPRVVPGASAMPGDPVLRYLLIDKGLITVEELTAAEEKLRSVGFLRT